MSVEDSPDGPRPRPPGPAGGQPQAGLPVHAGRLPALPSPLPGLQLPQPQHLHRLIPQAEWVDTNIAPNQNKTRYNPFSP